MYQRLIVIPIQDIVRMLSDYAGEDEIPSDSKALRLQYKPTEKGLLAIVIESPHIPTPDPLQIKLDLRQTFLAS